MGLLKNIAPRLAGRVSLSSRPIAKHSPGDPAQDAPDDAGKPIQPDHAFRPHPKKWPRSRKRKASRPGRQYSGLAGQPEPISLGIDLVMHSATKHLSGHSDVRRAFWWDRRRLSRRCGKKLIFSVLLSILLQPGWRCVACAPCRCECNGITRLRGWLPPIWPSMLGE